MEPSSASVKHFASLTTKSELINTTSSQQQQNLKAFVNKMSEATNHNNINNNNNNSSSSNGKSEDTNRGKKETSEPSIDVQSSRTTLQVKDPSAMMEPCEKSTKEESEPTSFPTTTTATALPIQMIQSHLGLNSHQLQALLQQQQHLLAFHQQKELMEAGRKQLEQLVQMNFLQQAHLSQHPELNKSLLEQLQMSQDNFSSVLQSQNTTMIKREYESGSRQNGASTYSDLSSAALRAALGVGKTTRMTNGDLAVHDTEQKRSQNAGSVLDHPLFSHGLCRWTGCEATFDSLKTFSLHLARDHVLDERSTAQTRVQVQIVSQLEQQLRREKERLEAMMEHLHPPRVDSSSPESAYMTMKNLSRKSSKSYETSLLYPPLSPISPPNHHNNEPSLLGTSSASHHSTTGPHFSVGGGLPTLTPKPAGSSVQQQHPRSASPGIASRKGPEERAVKIDMSSYHQQDECGSISPLDVPASIGSGRESRSRGSNLDPENEITRNRDFYRSHDVRPPFTYAALIRQAIVESPDRQLTLNEIYTWFQNTFAFFRRNAATWKNAVRHNLSLHKCFMRVENVKGAVWTVDEMEYHRRRPQRGTGASGSNDKSPNSFSYNDNYDMSPVPSGSLQQSLSVNGDYPLHGLSLDQQAAYLHGLGVQFTASFHGADKRNSGGRQSNNNNDDCDLIKRECPSDYLEQHSGDAVNSPKSSYSRSPRSEHGSPMSPHQIISESSRIRHSLQDNTRIQHILPDNLSIRQPASDNSRIRQSNPDDLEEEEEDISMNHPERSSSSHDDRMTVDEEKAEDLSRASNGASSRIRYHPYRTTLPMHHHQIKPEQET